MSTARPTACHQLNHSTREFVMGARIVRGIIAFVLAFTFMYGVLGTKKSLSMGGTQFGTYSKAYQDRQKCKANPPCKPKSH